MYAWARRPSEAAEVLSPLYRRAPTAGNTTLGGVIYGWALGEEGRHHEASRVLNETIDHARALIAAGSESPMLTMSLVEGHAVSGENDAAIEVLDGMIRNGWNFVFHLSRSPMLDGLRDDPRFLDLVERAERNQREMRERVQEGHRSGSTS